MFCKLSTWPSPFGKTKSSTMMGWPSLSFLSVSRFGHSAFHFRNVLMTIGAREMSRLPAFDLGLPILPQAPAR